MSFNAMFERLEKRRRNKAEGRTTDLGGPRLKGVKTVAEVFDGLRAYAPRSAEVTAQPRNPTRLHRGKEGLWKRRYGG